MLLIINQIISSTTDNKATGFCHDCGYFQCETCMDNHRKMRTLHHHKLSTVAELKEKQKDPTMQPKCEKHPNQNLTLYCREKECRVPACATCSHTTHRGHELIDIAAASAEIVSDLQHLASRVKKRNQVLTRKRAVLDKSQNILTEAYNLKQKDMYDNVQLLYNLIDSRYTDAQESLRNLHKIQTDRLTESFKTIDSISAQMTTACHFVNNACDMSHPTQLLGAQSQIQVRLRELDTVLLPDTSSHNTDLVYTANHHSVQAQIQESLQHLYDTEWRARGGKGGSTSGSSTSILTTRDSAPKPNPARKPPANAPSVPQRKPRADPALCTIQLKKPSDRKWYYRGIVQGMDYQGQLLETGGAEVEAHLEDGTVLEVLDNDNGTYHFDYLDNKFGNSVHVKINGMPMTGNPFNG